MVFFVGDVLMSARLILVGMFAVIDRLRKPQRCPKRRRIRPRVAVLIPAYNEEKVIVRTIRSVLNSDYANLHVIVIDDGSSDRTFEVAREAYRERDRRGASCRCSASQMAARLRPSTTLSSASTEDFYVGIDADTVIATRRGLKTDIPLRRPEGRRGRRKRQSRQSRESVDTLAGA